MKRLFILSASIFLLAAACNQTQPQANIPASPQPQAVQPAPQIKIVQPTSTNSSAAPHAPILTVTQTVDGSGQNKPSNAFVQGETAIQLLKNGHTVDVKEYPGIGEMVLAIGGIKADSQHFWEFFVNGKSSNVGASSYVLKNGDKIEWKLSTINSSGE